MSVKGYDCDRCGASIPGARGVLQLETAGKSRAQATAAGCWDLCPQCTGALTGWVKAGPKVAQAQGADDDDRAWRPW